MPRFNSLQPDRGPTMKHCVGGVRRIAAAKVAALAAATVSRQAAATLEQKVAAVL
ncbi:hypothetical protein [Bradyrhizobium guangzhouense]|uniref:hypothetical protein n=1 Tax=Bradyrhizobium guangzhouense TaxID=1325095 RepID=UPI0019D6EECC|nr:hypothetical protein [Bradyrhizobium guangzhouense]